MNRKRARVLLLAAAVVVTSAMAVGAPTASAAATAGGTVTGRVALSGEAPPPIMTAVTADPQICGDQQASESLVVGAEGGVQWAVVSIQGVDGERTPSDTPPVIDQHGCRFVPHVVVVGTGESLDVLNNDGVLHNVHTYSEINPVMNVAQPGIRRKMSVSFDNAEIFRIACDVHAWMAGWIVVTDSPYVVVTDASGAFTIPDVPPGTYEVKVWHETLGESTQQVTVADDGSAEITFEMSVD